jgi:RHS repeat-associated protein
MLGSTPILDDSYVYDANGNVLEITDRAQNIDRAMGYDGLDRLTTAIADNLLTETPDDALWGVGKYTYDALDNLCSSDQGTRKFRYQYDANWRLAAINAPDGAELYKFTHDPQGNTIAKNQQHFSFDSSNRMNSAEVLSGVGRQVYRYDGLGRRVQTTDPDGKPTYWLYTQAGQVLYTTEGRRSRNLSYIYLNGSQIATRAEEWAPSTTVSVHYQMTDLLGSPVASTDVEGKVAPHLSFNPWGEAASEVDGTGFTGHVTDSGTGLVYMQQRYYDSALAGFLTNDPNGVDKEFARNFSRLSYAANNPFRFTDPDGREEIETAKEARKKYGAGTEGKGHHWVPFGSTTKMDISSEARSVFGQAVSGEPLPTEEHLVGHSKYNEAVRAELVKYAADNHISLSQMTKGQAMEFVSNIRASHHPNIRPMISRVSAWTARLKATAPAFRGVLRSLVAWGVVNEVQSNMSDQQAACRADPVCDGERMK